ncbi:MAG: GNAT family N-acetyltransferase [SAR202 cluster bacterium]|jgi:mycothiol synthase|nr:GNAT family N-acetyltransferase [SAR202 cluster bacterium]
MTVKIRQFRWGDAEQITDLFNTINGIAGTEKEFSYQLMSQTLAHPSCKPEANCFVAELPEGQLVGYALVSPEIPIGRAVAGGGVLEAYRNQGIGRALIRLIGDYVDTLGVSVFHIQTSLDSQFARHMLESEGFVHVKDYWQMRWENGTLPHIDLPDGFGLRTFQLDQDEAELTSIQNAAFGEHWGFNPNTVKEIAARVRMDSSDPDGIIFISNGENLAGFNWTLRNQNENGSVGFVAMTGVHPNYRGKGLGTAVVVTGMEYLNEQGVDGIELEVDSANTPAVELYRKLGFKPVHHTVWYEKKIG